MKIKSLTGCLLMIYGKVFWFDISANYPCLSF